MALETTKTLPDGRTGTYLRLIMLNIDWTTGEAQCDLALYTDAEARSKAPEKVLRTFRHNWLIGKELALAYDETAHLLAAALAKIQTTPEWAAIKDQPYRLTITNVNWYYRQARVVVGLYHSAEVRDKAPQHPIEGIGFDWSGEDFPFDTLADDPRLVAYAALKADRPMITDIDENGDTIEVPGPLTWPDVKDI